MKKSITILTICIMLLTLSVMLISCNKCEHSYSSDCDETCDNCGEEREVSVEHIYYGDCDKSCHSCGKEREVTKEHSWKPATCTTPEGCEECGAFVGEALGHEWTTPDVDLCQVQSTCSRCGATDGEKKEHTPNEDDGDCTTAITCSVCGTITAEAKDNHAGGIATCTEKAVCVACGTVYGELNPDNHTFIDRVCSCGFIDATEMTAEQLNTSVAQLLAQGKTNIVVELPADADADAFPDSRTTMQYAIRSALSNSAVADGSVNLTIKGLKVVIESFLSKYSFYHEEIGEYVEEAAVTKIGSITLTDATEIGWSAFMDCTSLVSVSAPNASYIALYVFAGCTSLETLSLTTEGEITLGEINMLKKVFGDPSVSEQVQLILHANKQADVSENTFAGYTFESVAYICADGANMHSVGDVVAYFWNEDYTICSAGYTCTKCIYVDVKETVQATLEAITENGTAHSAVFTNVAFEAQTKTFGYVYDSATNTYSVWNEEGLNIWRLAVDEDYETNLILMDDITLSTDGITIDENGKPSSSNWEFVLFFEGTLDGNGHSIVNLRIYSENNAYFIGRSDGATIKNLTLVNPVVYGESAYTSGLVSFACYGTSIINCHVQGGSITCEMNGTGGLVGTVPNGTNYIYGCTNSAKVTGDQWVGGIVGSGGSFSGVKAIIVACANFGEISGNSNVGGIVGDPASYEMLIGCYTIKGNLCGNSLATSTDCYYVAPEDTDGEDGTTAVSDVNAAEVVNTMNSAIDTYNSTATEKCNYHWEIGDDDNPLLVKTTD